MYLQKLNLNDWRYREENVSDVKSQQDYSTEPISTIEIKKFMTN